MGLLATLQLNGGLRPNQHRGEGHQHGINFLSYNSTGLDSIKADYIRNLYNLTNSNFVSIQEHFKKTKSIDKFFKDSFPEHTSYVIPGVRENNQDSGRPNGQLRNKKINLS